jgi:hypothetical protein
VRAVTPLNAAEYEFIYPENLQAMGVSANTNIGPTAVQLEITYRPDFPLATDGTIKVNKSQMQLVLLLS